MVDSVRARIKAPLIRYYGIALISVKEKLAYRFDFVTSLLGTLLFAALYYYIWVAIYENSENLPMPLTTLVTYVCLGQVLSLHRIGWLRRSAAYSAAGNISSGDIIIDLTRPLDYLLLRLSDAIGLFLTEMMLLNLPAYFMCLLLFRIEGPASLEASIGFVVSLGVAVLLAFSLDFLVGLSAFWTMNIRGLFTAKRWVLDILAGVIIPLSLMPDWLREVAQALPFPGIAYVPLSIYVGTIAGREIWTAILGQLAWAVGLLVFARLVWYGASRRIVIQGG